VRVRTFFVVLFSVLTLLFVAAPSALASDPRSGPAAAQIVETFPYADGLASRNAALRAGNTTFGQQHIAIGGSTRNTSNHELTPAAKVLWKHALAAGPKAFPFFGGKLFTHRFIGPGNQVRTMCVVVDENDYNFGAVNYGSKGIITAFWVVGDAGPAGSGCRR
jgi:hypothetical protein